MKESHSIQEERHLIQRELMTNLQGTMSCWCSRCPDTHRPLRSLSWSRLNQVSSRRSVHVSILHFCSLKGFRVVAVCFATQLKNPHFCFLDWKKRSVWFKWNVVHEFRSNILKQGRGEDCWNNEGVRTGRQSETRITDSGIRFCVNEILRIQPIESLGK